jgi:hypothetical protein
MEEKGTEKPNATVQVAELENGLAPGAELESKWTGHGEPGNMTERVSPIQEIKTTSAKGQGVRWNHVSNHALTVLGIAPPELYINPLVLHHFMYFRQLLM